MFQENIKKLMRNVSAFVKKKKKGQMAFVFDRATSSHTAHSVDVYLGLGLFSFSFSHSHCDEGDSATRESRETFQIR